MNNTTEPILKMRFRLPNGEEFEAEGTREFIEKQRNYFLALIGQNKAAEQASLFTNTVSSGHSQQIVAPPPNNVSAMHTESVLWERLFKEDGSTLILRRKTKLSLQDLASLILAAAAILLHNHTYSALELSRSLKACGWSGEGRLDRILASEIQAGRLVGEGAKRGRTYKLTDEGSAKAFVLAEKLLKQP